MTIVDCLPTVVKQCYHENLRPNVYILQARRQLCGTLRTGYLWGCYLWIQIHCWKNFCINQIVDIKEHILKFKSQAGPILSRMLDDNFVLCAIACISLSSKRYTPSVWDCYIKREHQKIFWLILQMWSVPRWVNFQEFGSFHLSISQPLCLNYQNKTGYCVEVCELTKLSSLWEKNIWQSEYPYYHKKSVC